MSETSHGRRCFPTQGLRGYARRLASRRSMPNAGMLDALFAELVRFPGGARVSVPHWVLSFGIKIICLSSAAREQAKERRLRRAEGLEPYPTDF